MSNDVGIVIIGGGQAGGWAAKTLRDDGYQGRMTVVSDEPYDFYERPPLSKKVLTDRSEDLGLSRLFSEQVVESLDIDWRRPVRAESLDPQQKALMLSNGERLEYNQLLLATGGSPRVPHADWLTHPRVHTLRSWDDAQRLKTALGSCQRLGIIGGGWIGLEIASSARQLGIDVTVFECQPLLCQRSVGASVSQALLQLHQQQGVTVHCGCGEITFSNPKQHQALPLIGSNSTASQAFDCVVVGIGVTLNTALAQQAGLEMAAGIVVDVHGRTSDPAIFAAGDVAMHPTLGFCPQSWSYAQNQAIATAHAMLNPQSEGYSDHPWIWSDQYHANIQILGLVSGECEQITRNDAGSQLYFSLNAQRQLVQLVAFNDARTVKLAKRWMASGRVLDPEQLADSTFSLMSLR